MSADNFIAVQRRGRHFHVWMGFESDPEPHIPFGPDHRKFLSESEAHTYAWELYNECAIVEYGLGTLNDISRWEDMKQRLRHHLWMI